VNLEIIGKSIARRICHRKSERTNRNKENSENMSSKVSFQGRVSGKRNGSEETKSQKGIQEKERKETVAL
jgi:hypothetical protein